MNELQPCPFCGAIPKTNVRYWQCGGAELMLTAEVVCKCGIKKGRSFQANNTSFGNFIEAFDLAIEDWNRRADNDRV